MSRPLMIARALCTAGMFLSGIPAMVHAQTGAKIRKPYPEEVVVEPNAVVVALPQHAAHWRSTGDGQTGFYSWRIDANAGAGFSIVLAADTMMRTANLAQVVAGSSLRKCQDAHNPSARSCTLPLRDSVGVKDEFVQIILRDPAAVAYFRESRPPTVSVSTFDPHGRFRLERFRVSYRDRITSARTQR